MRPEKDLIEFLTENNHADAAESIQEYCMNTISMNLIEKNDELPIGSSKLGGFPDLPPEIEYPTMTGYTCKYKEREERYEKSAMQLVAQINLKDIADFDKENKLPHTGMLYFFWSGEIFSISKSNKIVDMLPDDPENSALYKVIYYSGDLSSLRRTAPVLPYYSKYFTESFAEAPITFDSSKDYINLGNVLDEEQYENLQKIVPEYDIENLSERKSKLLGFPNGGNIPSVDENNYLLFQYNYNVGMIYNLFWTITKEDLSNLNFENAGFDFDLD